MGLFDSLFGLSRKENITEMIPDPPRFRLAEGSVEGLTGGIQGLIDTFERRRRGQDQFDFIRFMFEPQLQQLNRAYGIESRGEGTLGPLGRREGALGRLEADLQKRGLFDTGSSAVLAAQLESERAQKEAELFGEAKQLQRADVDAALQSLNVLFPQQFEARNIPSQVDFFNAMNQYQAQSQRNIATAQQRQQRAGQKSRAIMSGIGLGMAALPFSGAAGAGGTVGGQSLFTAGMRGLSNLFQTPKSPMRGFDQIHVGPGGERFVPSAPPVGYQPGFRGLF